MIRQTDSINKTRIILLAGFLGAGKTTLLRHILAWETDLHGTAVIVNEFGEIGIDGALLKDSCSTMIELSSGCICCSLKTDLKETLLEIHQELNPRKIIIEASGVSDPQTIITLFEEDQLGSWATFIKTVTVLDASIWEARDAFGELFYNQLKTAQLILLNKVDTISDEQTVQFIKEIRELIPGVEIIPTSNCNVDEQSFWDGSLFVSRPKEQIMMLQDLRTGRSIKFNNISFETEHALREDCFEDLLKHLPFEIFRIKGHVKFLDRTMFLNYVGGKAEWKEWKNEALTRLVIIGWNESGNAFLERLKTCQEIEK